MSPRTTPQPLGTTILLLSLIVLSAFPLNAQEAIGRWRDCLDYSLVSLVEPAGDMVYAAGRNGIFVYDTLYGTVSQLSKSSGLSDAGIGTMAYDPTTQTLVVAYSNSNIDLVCGTRVYNLSDIKRSETSGDKTIYRIRFFNGNALLATGFGIVVVDLQRHEIKETLYIGPDGGYTQVADIALSADSLYAATTEGLKRISLAEPYMGVSDRWTADPRLSGMHIATLEWFDGQLLAATYTYDPARQTLYSLRGTTRTQWNGGDVRSMRVGGNKVTLSWSTGISCYDANLQQTDSIANLEWGDIDAHDAVVQPDGDIWIGHDWNALVHIRPNGSNETIHAAGPLSSDNVFRLVGFNKRMLLCPGGHTSTYASSFLGANLLTCTRNGWHSLDKSNGMLAGMSDVVDVAVNPYDTTELVAALWGQGLFSIRDNAVATLYNENNTDGALVPYSVSGYSTLRAGAVQFDYSGNLWVLVSHSSSALARRSPDGSWQRYPTTTLATAPALDKLVWDSITGYLWFCGRDNVIYVHDGNDRMARVSPNHGSKLQTDAVTALVQDRTGNLWIGTNKGIKVIYDGYNAFRNGGNGEISPVNCSNITITNGEFYEYLMAYESITAIAVDGANRKWVGTSSGGLYLLSSNGLEQLQHFTTANSPLFSNKIVAIGIQPYTGEVFVGTDRGLQVYRSTATYAESEPLDEVHAFPNPVRPNYDGPIAIKGFTRDGLVHITDAAGHTVYTTQALGGQAIWYGRTNSGEAVASGVYFIFAADGEGRHRSVGKVLIVR